MLMRKPQYRRFEYQPRYYDPSKDERIRQKRRIRFERPQRRRSHRPFIVVLLLFVLVYFLYLAFQ